MIDQILCMHDGKPQWRNAGNWGLLTWDHQLPGVIIGSNMYVLKLSWDYASYPSVGTAEIRVRNYGDRDNHNFVTYAKLNQIAADGNLSQDAYIFTDGNSLFYTAIVTWYRESGSGTYKFTPTKTVLYRLDSVDAYSVGSFTLLGSKTMDVASSSGAWAINGHPSLSWTDNGYYKRLSEFGTRMFNQTLDTSTRYTYSDYYGTFHAYLNEKGDADYFLSPYTTSLTSRIVTMHEEFTPRALKGVYLGGGAWENSKVLEPTQTMTMPGISGVYVAGAEAVGLGWDYPSQTVFNGVRPWVWRGASLLNPDGLSIPHPVTFSNNWNNDYCEAWGLADEMTNWNSYSGAGSLVTRNYVINHDKSSMDLFDMPSYTPTVYGTTPDLMVGLWGSVNAAIWMNARVISDANSLHSGSRGVDYTDFYVIKGSDTANASRYSIFSGVEGDGSILHIEGLEDPTPTLWIDNTFVGNIN